MHVGLDFVSEFAEHLGLGCECCDDGGVVVHERHDEELKGSGGFSGECELGIRCNTVADCSWYQDRAVPISPSKRYGFCSYLDCSGTCDFTIAVWGIGGPAGNDVRVLEVSSLRYVATTVTFPNAPNSLRFEVYNNDTGVWTYLSDPMLVEA